jgi:hypothetical protein
MTLKSKIQEAKDAVNAALIAALESKTEYVLSDLFEVYKTLKSLDSKVYDNVTFTSPSSFYGINTDDVISFNTNDNIRLG